MGPEAPPASCGIAEDTWSETEFAVAAKCPGHPGPSREGSARPLRSWHPQGSWSPSGQWGQPWGHPVPAPLLGDLHSQPRRGAQPGFPETSLVHSGPTGLMNFVFSGISSSVMACGPGLSPTPPSQAGSHPGPRLSPAPWMLTVGWALSPHPGLPVTEVAPATEDHGETRVTVSVESTCGT